MSSADAGSKKQVDGALVVEDVGVGAESCGVPFVCVCDDLVLRGIYARVAVGVLCEMDQSRCVCVVWLLRSGSRFVVVETRRNEKSKLERIRENGTTTPGSL